MPDMRYSGISITAALLILCSVGMAQDEVGGFGRPGKGGFEQAKKLSVKLTPSQLAVEPGKTFFLAVEISIADGWVYYSPNPGGPPEVSPQPAGMDFSGEDMKLLRVLWPADSPHTNDLNEINNVYTGKVVVYLELSLAGGTGPGEKKFTVSPTGQICKDVCIAVRDIKADGRIEAGSTQPNPAWHEYSAGMKLAVPANLLPSAQMADRSGEQPSAPPRPELTIWAAMGLAILAGLTLNIMPCVLPVIPLRIYTIVRMAGESSKRYVFLGMAFAVGVFAFFAGLAAVNVALKLLVSRSFNWADHFQISGVRIALLLIVVAVATNLLGAFNIVVPSRIASLEGSGRPRQGALATFGMGLMMAVLATPCSFAVLATVMVWAQGQVLWLGSLTLCVIGLGMAIPHILVAAFPQLVKWLPQPGRWMELFRQSMGFLMLIVAAWLVGTFIENSYAVWVMAYAVVLAYCLWMWGSWTDPGSSLAKRITVKTLSAAIAIGMGLWMLQPPADAIVKLEQFDEAKISTANRQGRTVLVKFTAAWCTECRVVEKKIYEDPQVASELNRRGILAMKGDSTDRDMPAAGWLAVRGLAVPVTVIFPPGGGEKTYLIGLFNKQELFGALDKASRKGG